MGPRTADHVALPAGAQNAGLGHQQDGVGRWLRPMAAAEFQPRCRTERMGPTESELDPVSEQNPRPVLERRHAIDRLAVDAERAEWLDQVGFAVAAEPSVPT